MQHQIWIPDFVESSRALEKRLVKTNVNSVVFFGGSSCGKSRLAKWLADSQEKYVLTFGFSLKEELDSELELASIKEMITQEAFAFFIKAKKAKENKKEQPEIPETILDNVNSIWTQVFPGRKIGFDGKDFYIQKFSKEKVIAQYGQNDMSPTEKRQLSLIAKVLVAPKDTIFVVDEPDSVIGKDLAIRSWALLEAARPDALFVYTTFSSLFAARYESSRKFWIKGFNGKYWIFEEISEGELPQDLLLRILGSKKKVLFVEGKYSGLDEKVYSAVFPNFLVIATEGCENVLAKSREFKAAKVLKGTKCFGIIDRDFKCEKELRVGVDFGVYPLKVAEVENLFLTEEVVKEVARLLNLDPISTFQAVKNHVINNWFKDKFEDQSLQAAEYEMRHLINTRKLNLKDNEDVENYIISELKKLNLNDVRKEAIRRYESAWASKDYKEILKVYNEKGVAKTVGKIFGIPDSEYLSRVCELLASKRGKRLIEAFALYVPKEIPRS